MCLKNTVQKWFSVSISLTFKAGVFIFRHSLSLSGLRVLVPVYMTLQILEPSAPPRLLLSRTSTAWFPKLLYQVDWLRLRYVDGAAVSNSCCCCCQINSDVSRKRSRPYASDRAFSAKGGRAGPGDFTAAAFSATGAGAESDMMGGSGVQRRA